MARDPYYLRARYYDPEIGRFWSRDPAGGSTTQAQSWNLYSYALNNPVNLIDPSGLDAEGPILIPAPLAPSEGNDDCVEEFEECRRYVKSYGYHDAVEFICVPLLAECQETGTFARGVYIRRIQQFVQADYESLSLFDLVDDLTVMTA